MLYDRWRQIANGNRKQPAIEEVASGRRMTFGQLAAAAETSLACGGDWAFPQGTTVDFVLAVLRAWQSGQVVCPLEPGQAEPAFDGSLPSGAVHLKTTSATTATSRYVAFT